MVMKCYICKRHYDKNSEISFHAFPKATNCRTAWETACKLQQPVSKTARICSKHFTADSFMPKRDYGIKLLKPSAIPSIFSWNQQDNSTTNNNSNQLCIQHNVASPFKQSQDCANDIASSSSELIILNDKCNSPKTPSTKDTNIECNLSVAGTPSKRFPLLIEPVLRQWIQATGRENWIPGESSRICELHFKPTDFHNKPMSKRKLLKADVVPTVKVTNHTPHVKENAKPSLEVIVLDQFIQNKTASCAQESETSRSSGTCEKKRQRSPDRVTKLEDEIKRLQGVIESMRKQHEQDLKVQADMFKRLMFEKEEELKKKKTDVQTELQLFKRQANRKNTKTAMKIRMLLDLIKESNIMSSTSYDVLEQTFEDSLLEDKNHNQCHNYAKVDGQEILPRKRHRLTKQILLSQ